MNQVLEAAGSAAAPSENDDEVVVLPTSLAQERMWFLDRLAEGSGAYNIPVAVRLTGTLHADALTAALAGVVARHEVLRTRFPTVDGVPVQVVAPTGAAEWPLVDLSHLSPAEREPEAARLVAEAAAWRFSLGRGPLVRTLLVRLAADEHVALCTLHHIVADGWSLEVMVRELAEGYAAAVEGRAPRLAPLAIQYGDYAEWQREWMEGAGYRAQVDHWAARLSGAPADIGLPLDRPRDADVSFRGASVDFRIPPGTRDAVAALCRAHGVTSLAVLLAAFKALLSRWSGQADVVVGSPVANRARPELEPLIGFFANTVALRTELSGDPTFSDLLDRVRRTLAEAQANQEAPYHKVVERLRPATPAGANPLFQVAFNHRVSLANGGDVALPGLTMRPLRAGYDSAKFDLQVYLEEHAGGVDGALFYHPTMFDARTVERLAARYVRLLAAAVAAPHTPIAALPMLSDGETAELRELGRALAASPGSTIRPLIDRVRPSADASVASIRIVDSRGAPMPVGAWGEVAIAFAPSTEAEDASTDVRTGERARWRADGTLEHAPSAGAADASAGARRMARPATFTEHVGARDEVEAALVEIWKEVLGVEQVGVHDGFFELGGYSLLMVKVATRTRAALKVEVPVGVIFAHPSVAELAWWIREHRATASAAVSSTEVVPVPRTGPLPLSAEQERLWFMSHVGGTQYSYTVAKGMRLKGMPVDAARLADAFTLVSVRHEALRTVFRTHEGEEHQVVLAPSLFDLPVLDLSALPDDEREAELRRVSLAESERPFDMENGPLFRALLVRLGETEHALLTHVHHIVTDAWSTGILVAELLECYRALGEGREPELAPLPVQYADYAAWQRRWLEGAQARGQLAYWKAKLAGAPALELRPDRPRTEPLSYAGAALRMLLPEDASARLRELAAERQVTLFMLLLAGFKAVLAHRGGQRDVVVGIDVANRRTREVERLIGFFINELVLRTDLRGDPTFEDLLGRVREVTLGAYENQDLPFGLLVKELGARRGLGTNPLFQVMFGLKNAPAAEVDLGGLHVEGIEVPSEVAVFELCLYMQDTPQGIAGLFTYRTDLFDAAWVEAFRDDLGLVLGTAAERPGVRLEELMESLDARERARRAERARAAGQAGRALLMNVRRREMSAATANPQE
jgi:non-ribosomal peptide synthetase component F